MPSLDLVIVPVYAPLMLLRLLRTQSTLANLGFSPCRREAQIEHVWVNICAIGPDDGARLAVDLEPLKVVRFSHGLEDRTPEVTVEVNLPHRTVRERELHDIIAHRSRFLYAHEPFYSGGIRRGGC